MQNKQQMLASPLARATYTKFQQQRVAATVCRGTAGDDLNFFYSDLPYWADNCLGWVADDAQKSKICAYCSLVTPAERAYFTKIDTDEIRNSDRVPRQDAKSCKPRRSGVSGVQPGGKHRGKGNKDVPSHKIKEDSKGAVQKTNKKSKK